MNRRFSRPYRVSDRSHRRIQSDNITLIPASQLPFKEEWASIAQSLPAREVLLVIPSTESPFKRIARALVPQLRARGRQVTAVVT